MSIISPKKALRRLRSRGRRAIARHPEARQWFKWLQPGLLVKRWLLTSAVGVLLASLGFAIWSDLTPIFRILRFIKTVLGQITNIFPSHISGPMAIAIGFLLIYWGQKRAFGNITQALMAERDEELVDVLLHHRRLHKGPKIVAIGGGTGLSNLLRGLKDYSANITAIVTVADDGGSSGRLRREMGVLPPGDIRNCVAALADSEKLITELFQHRFESGTGLTGHSFGNLFLTAMTEVTGDLEQAIAASSKVLAVRGQVLPATLEDVNLWAELEDGRLVRGESNITKAGGRIARFGCTPSDPLALPRALQAIREADLIAIGPGSLYTSVIPNLLVPEIAEAIARTAAPRIYICNIMTEPGETLGYSVSDHIRAIDTVCHRPLFDAVLVQKRSPSAQALIRYAQRQAHPVDLDREAVRETGRELVSADIMAEGEAGQVRHHSQRLARAILHWYARVRRV